MLDTDPSDDAGDDAGAWAFVADSDGAAKLFGTLVDLDADDAYTRSELAERSGVPLKTLYLNDLIAAFVDRGVLETEVAPSDDEGEPRYRVVPDSDLLAAAAAFEDAYRSQTD
ncbi:hypothetical protein [Halosimplex sp. TS25]|uniref:hypothetical protein n=1 Tax=Halosimplex rarum TaxID=3396619 RepID=UPI0039EA8B6B